jgi:electron transport complex protein RnfG
MKKLESNFKNMVLVLSAITLFAAAALSSVYTFTKEPIALSKLAKQQNAIREVLPPYDHLEAKPFTENEGTVYKAYDKNNVFLGSAVQSISNGFSGNIDVIVGFDANGNILNYLVLDQKETPGLGSKMVDWFKTEKGNQSIIGKNPATYNLLVKKNKGDVDAITAATISSKAFLFAVRSAYTAFLKHVEANSADQIPVNNTDSTKIN